MRSDSADLTRTELPDARCTSNHPRHDPAGCPLIAAPRTRRGAVMSAMGDSRGRLAALLFGYMPVKLAYVMARLRLADLLQGRRMTITELSGATCTQPMALRRVVRGLAGIG